MRAWPRSRTMNDSWGFFWGYRQYDGTALKGAIPCKALLSQDSPLEPSRGFTPGPTHY